jgi:dienelactone hydrolase
MGTHLKLTASDGHKFDAYRVDPAGTPKGGIVVIQEIFGVNRHIRSVADRFAALGYVAIAVADDLKVGKRPASMQPDEATVYEFCMDLAKDHVESLLS